MAKRKRPIQKRPEAPRFSRRVYAPTATECKLWTTARDLFVYWKPREENTDEFSVGLCTVLSTITKYNTTPRMRRRMQVQLATHRPKDSDRQYAAYWWPLDEDGYQDRLQVLYALATGKLGQNVAYAKATGRLR